MLTPGDHRRDIDGLRGIAVLAVLLFHAEVPGFSGGYAGVDVFFVISGYLITDIITRQLDAETFSLAAFYERRARRILPALFVVTGCTLAAGWIALMPADYRDLAGAGAAAIGFVANLYYLDHLRYFAPAAELSPLVHTWSLAVEEQFYIGFPLVVLALTRWCPRRRTSVMAAAFALSFCGAGATVWRAPADAFYLTHLRAWELLAGSLLALRILEPPRRAWVRELTAVAAGALILVPVAVYDRDTLFPGAAALAPVLGTAMVIAVRDSRVNRALMARPLVFAGLISYSLYLWHWPVLAFLRIWTGTLALSAVATAGALATSCALAAASWALVEQPARHARLRRPLVFRAAVGVAVVLLGATAVIRATDGVPDRVAADLRRVAAGADDFDTRRYSCFLGHLPDAERCRIGRGTHPDSLLWGDSHAAALVPGLDGMPGAAVFAGRDSCPPLLGVDTFGRDTCSAFNQRVLDWLDTSGADIRTVMLAARWPLYETGRDVEGGRFRQISVTDHSRPDVHAAVFQRGLERTLAALQARGKRIVLFGPVPEMSFNVPRTFAEQLHLGHEPPEAPTSTRVARRTAGVRAAFATVRRRFRFELVDVEPVFCRTGRCLPVVDGRAVYSDGDHLSVFAARDMLGPFLAQRWSTLESDVVQRRVRTSSGQ
ncbi:MAG: acyltransferase family protein [Vicinamibacterales bacterium]